MTEDELKQKVKQIVIDIDKQYSWQDVDILLTYIDLLEFRQFRYERALGVKENPTTILSAKARHAIGADITDAGNELILEFINRLERLPWNTAYNHALETADMLLMDVVRVLTWTKDPAALTNAELFRAKYDKLRTWSWQKKYPDLSRD